MTDLLPELEKWYTLAEGESFHTKGFSDCLFFVYNPQLKVSAFYVSKSSDKFLSAYEYLEKKWETSSCLLKCIYPTSQSRPDLSKDIEIKTHEYSEGHTLDLFVHGDSGKIQIQEKKEQAPSPPQPYSDSSFPIKVLIVDDSSTVRKVLNKAISSLSRFSVVAETGDPREVNQLVEKHKPDVMTLDIHMPEMTGVDVLKSMPIKNKIPAVVITSLNINEGNLVLEALENGAVDYLKKPSLNELQQLEGQLEEKLSIAAKQKNKSPATTFSQSQSLHLRQSNFSFDPYKLILIGCSTGGPEALGKILPSFPSNMPPILIVQHIPAVFSKALADRVNQNSAITVKEAEDGELIKPGHAYIAPGGQHITFKEESRSQRFIQFSGSELFSGHCPSVDKLFLAAAKSYTKDLVVALLTGMGKDGAKGLLEIKKNGGMTITQSEKSCVVYGMPRAADQLKASQKSVDLEKIALELANLTQIKSAQIAS